MQTTVKGEERKNLKTTFVVYDAFSKYLGFKSDSNILKLTPGLFEEFKDMNHFLREGSDFKVLLCGRSVPKDFRLKGYDIAAKAFACRELREPSYLLIFVGALKRKQQKMKAPRVWYWRRSVVR